MCYDDNARPPVPPGAAGATSTEDLILTASDGNRFAAFAAYPAAPAESFIIIYPDVRGLHQFYKELALRFAETGTAALAIDYFGRTAGLTPREEPFEFMPHVQQMQLDTLLQDLTAGLAHMHAKVGANVPSFLVGFCMGGSYTLLTGTNPEFHFSGLLPFYAGLSRPFGGRGTVLDNADKVLYPVQGFFGGADQGIPQTEIDQLDAGLAKAGIDHRLEVYAGAPHSFFDRRSTDFVEASSDAWRRALEFIAGHKQPA